MLFVMLENIYKDPTNDLATRISATIFMSRYDYQFLYHDAKGGGEEGVSGPNVIMTLIKKISLEVPT